MKLFYSYGTALCLLGVLTAPVLAMEEGFEKIGELPNRNIQVMRSTHMSDEENKIYDTVYRTLSQKHEPSFITSLYLSQFFHSNKTEHTVYSYRYTYDKEEFQRCYLPYCDKYFKDKSEVDSYLDSLRSENSTDFSDLN